MARQQGGARPTWLQGRGLHTPGLACQGGDSTRWVKSAMCLDRGNREALLFLSALKG